MNLLVAKKLLRETKVQLALAHSGMECLKLTAKNNYDVIFYGSHDARDGW